MSLLVSAKSTERGIAVFDSRSPAHFAFGYVAGAIGMDDLLFTMLAVAYEGVMIVAEQGNSGLFKRNKQDSYANHAGDLTARLVGFSIGRHSRTWTALR